MSVIIMHSTNLNSPDRHANGAVFTLEYSDQRKAEISLSGIPRMSPGEFRNELELLASAIDRAVKNHDEITGDPEGQPGRVIFLGQPPFSISRAQSGSARDVGGAVELTVKAIVDGQGPLPVEIAVPLTADQALTIGGRLLGAAASARQS
jgi:hypothetical protein